MACFVAWKMLVWSDKLHRAAHDVARYVARQVLRKADRSQFTSQEKFMQLAAEGITVCKQTDAKVVIWVVFSPIPHDEERLLAILVLLGRRA
jgi:hypothetical protein